MQRSYGTVNAPNHIFAHISYTIQSTRVAGITSTATRHQHAATSGREKLDPVATFFVWQRI